MVISLSLAGKLQQAEAAGVESECERVLSGPGDGDALLGQDSQCCSPRILEAV